MVIDLLQPVWHRTLQRAIVVAAQGFERGGEGHAHFLQVPPLCLGADRCVHPCNCVATIAGWRGEVNASMGQAAALAGAFHAHRAYMAHQQAAERPGVVTRLGSGRAFIP